jgi:hypothetical protein
MELWQYILIGIGVVAVLLLIIYFIKKLFGSIEKYHHLPLRELGFTEMPAAPYSVAGTIATIVKLQGRVVENRMAKEGLCNSYIIQGETESAYTFLYDQQTLDEHFVPYERLRQKLEKSEDHLMLDTEEFKKHIEQTSFDKEAPKEERFTSLFLDKPEQFSLSWTNYYGIYKDAIKKYKKQYAAVLTDADAASEQFWPMISENGLAYNLLFLEKVQGTSYEKVKRIFFKEWSAILEPAYNEGALYAIDLTIFSQWGATKVHGFDRWTPGAFIILKQDKISKKLTPVCVQISGTDTNKAQIYSREHSTDEAWIFAMAAARTAVTVYGIWLGHVYHWHIVTAAMQMTLFNNVDKNHDLRKFLDPQSKSLIGFNDTLFLLWKKIGPPTSFASTKQFLELTNSFATGRDFFDDDPKTAIKNLGLSKEDFTEKSDWDRYPIVRDLLEIWEISEEMVDVFVNTTYDSDDAVFNDKQLQTWISESSNPEQGNIRGLPVVNSKEELKRVLTSLVYRVTAHGNSRLNRSLGPGLSFVSNYPPCLQYTKIIKPTEKPSTQEILRYLPNTGTIGSMMTFYYIFIFSAPYNPLVPLFGNHEDLYFKDPSDPRNQALVTYRRRISEFIRKYDQESPLIHQWPSSIET